MALNSFLPKTTTLSLTLSKPQGSIIGLNSRPATTRYNTQMRVEGRSSIHIFRTPATNVV